MKSLRIALDQIAKSADSQSVVIQATANDIELVASAVASVE